MCGPGCPCDCSVRVWRLLYVGPNEVSCTKDFVCTLTIWIADWSTLLLYFQRNQYSVKETTWVQNSVAHCRPDTILCFLTLCPLVSFCGPCVNLRVAGVQRRRPGQTGTQTQTFTGLTDQEDLEVRFLCSCTTTGPWEERPQWRKNVSDIDRTDVRPEVPSQETRKDWTGRGSDGRRKRNNVISRHTWRRIR